MWEVVKRTPGSFGVIPVLYRGHQKGSGGPHGLRGAGSQPLVGWAHPLPWALAPRVEGGTLEGAPPLAWGASPPLPSPLGRRTPPRWVLGGRPPSPFPL